MDQERERIQDDFRGLIEGDVHCDDVFAQLYASDASIYEIKPLGVIRPRGLTDVIACVQYAAEHQIPIHARGAGTGLAGESIGPGLVVDFSRHMRRIVRTTEDTVTVQPGVVLSQLNHELAKEGRIFGPDPATSKVTTIGGMIGVDGSGSHWLKYGSTRGRVERLQVVLSDGAVVDMSTHAYSRNDRIEGADRLGSIVQRVGNLIERESSVIDERMPKCPVNRSGYALNDVIFDGRLEMARLMVGSEGTLGLVTEATLKTDPLPNNSGVALFLFDRLQTAAKAALEVRRIGATACDLMDRRLLTLARESDVRYEVLLPEEAEALLLVEQQGDSPAEVRQHLQQLIHLLCRRKRLAIDSRIALERDDVDFFWRLARHVVPSLYRLEGSERPLPFVEDMAVPADSLPDFLIQTQNILKKHHVISSVFCHAAHGQLHLRPFLDVSDPEQVKQMQNLARDLYEAAVAIGGTVSGEHGDGLSRSWFLREQFGELYNVFSELKRIFDPQNILNPGKIVDVCPQSLAQNLRPVKVGQAIADGSQSTTNRPMPVTDESPPPLEERKTIQLQLNWSAGEMAHVARSCNGCGSCRTLEGSERMCPIFRFAPAEEASPRAKANLMRAIMTGQIDPSELAGDAIRSVANLCVNCHQCRLECPASVDIPKLMIECKGQHVSATGLRMSDWLLGRLDLIAALASRVHPLANWALANRRARWVLERTMGLSMGRKMPRLARRPFLRRAQRLRLASPVRRRSNKILYFLDIHANWFDVQLAEALVAVMQHNGIAVYVHPRQMASGMSLVSLGALDKAKQVAARNLSILADAVRQGYHIITTEPSAALCLSHEYPNLIDDVDARLVADHTSDACVYLWRIHQQGKLELDLKPLNATIGYHEPCHVRALSHSVPGENLLRLVPGLTVNNLNAGCSGMAGVYGLKRENYRSSLRAGWGLISAVRDPSIQIGSTECSACKLQMEQGTTKPTIHPLKIMALSYGLMPELSELLTKRSEEYFVT